MDRARAVFSRLLKPQIILPVVGLVILCAALLWYPSLWQETEYPGRTTPFFEMASELVNLNTATLEELTLLPGVGEAKATAIIGFREENGEFTSIEELLDVKGIGEATFADLKEMICV